jgi:hypothetical protein
MAVKQNMKQLEEKRKALSVSVLYFWATQDIREI